MRVSVALTVGILVGALALASCGGGEEATPTPKPTIAPAQAAAPTATAAPAPTATTRPTAAAPTLAATARPIATATTAPAVQASRERVVVGVTDLGQEVFATFNSSSNAKFPVDPVYDWLFYFDFKSLSFSPGLATDWKISPDGLTWTIKLRRGIKFSDGSDFTAADVKFLVEKAADLTSRHPFTGQWNRAFQQATVTASDEVQVSLKAPFADFVEQLSDFWALGVMSKSHWDRVGERGFEDNPVGTGPYRRVARTIGASYTYRAVDRHWRYGVPGFKELVMKLVPENATRLAGLRTGELDVITATLNQVSQIKGLKEFRLIAVPGAFATGLYLGGQFAPDYPTYDPKEPFLKLDVRKAVNLAINRQEIVDTVMQGTAVPGTMMPYLLPGWDELKPYPFDPEQAKRLLVQAGYPNGFKVKAYSVAERPEHPLLLQAICGYWAAINVQCEIIPTDVASFRSNIWYTGTTGSKFGGSVFPFSVPPRSEYESGMRACWAPRAFCPAFYDPEVWSLVEDLGKSLEPTRRRELYRQIGKLQVDHYRTAPVVLDSALLAVRDDLISPDWKPPFRWVIGGFETLVPRK